jgi:hypothetical protein
MSRIVSLLDWAARVHFVGTVLWGTGGWAVTFFGTSASGWDAATVWLSSLFAGACCAFIFVAVKAGRHASEPNGGSRLIERSTSNDRIRLTLTGDGPFSTVATAGVNRRRTVRVKINNNTDHPLSNGTLRVLNLDPPYRGHTEFFLKGDISIPAREHTFVDVAYYDEGTSRAERGKSMYLAVPLPPFAEAIPALPISSPHTFHLKFLTLEGVLFDELYCRLSLDSGILRFVDWAANPIADPPKILLHEAATRAYEALEDKPYGIAVYGLADAPDDRLIWLCNAIFRYVDGKKPLATLYGSEAPSRVARPLMVEAYNNYDFQIDQSTIVLKSRYDTSQFQNLSVDAAELDAAINELANREV